MTNTHKNKFKGEFNLLGQLFTLYTWATHKDKSFLNFIHQLNKKTGIPKFQLYSIFDNCKDNYRITGA